MRRIFAILLIIFVGFWVAYGLAPPVKATVDQFAVNTVGPVAFNAVNTIYTGVLSSVGVGGFAAIVLGSGFIVGIIVHRLWVAADWKMWRWSQGRAQSKLGTTPVTSLPSTPVGATIRPEPAPQPVAQPTPAPLPVAEEKPKEET